MSLHARLFIVLICTQDKIHTHTYVCITNIVQYIHMISYYRILRQKLPLRPTGCNNNGQLVDKNDQLYDIWTSSSTNTKIIQDYRKKRKGYDG